MGGTPWQPVAKCSVAPCGRRKSPYGATHEAWRYTWATGSDFFNRELIRPEGRTVLMLCPRQAWACRVAVRQFSGVGALRSGGRQCGIGWQAQARSEGRTMVIPCPRRAWACRVAVRQFSGAGAWTSGGRRCGGTAVLPFGRLDYPALRQKRLDLGPIRRGLVGIRKMAVAAVVLDVRPLPSGVS